MIQMIRPPRPFPRNTRDCCVFLGGSIEQGKAEEWQENVFIELKNKFYWNVIQVNVLNPRRKEWNSSWKQEKNFRPFRRQVEWELDAQEEACVLFYYFDPQTYSPITLMELGLNAQENKPIVVLCPKGYWRKGNVDIVCERFDIGVYEYWNNAMDALKEKIQYVLATMSPTIEHKKKAKKLGYHYYCDECGLLFKKSDVKTVDRRCTECCDEGDVLPSFLSDL